MPRLASRWGALLLLVAALAVLVPLAVFAGLAPFGSENAVAEEEVTAQTGAAVEEGELRSLPADPEGGVQAAPAQSGGEPFRTCETCHPNYLEMPPVTGDLIFSHPVHLEKDVKCATCHEPPLGHFGAPAPLMMVCLSCHQGETAPNQCGNCHRKLDEIAPGLDEPVVHLEPDVKSRKTCEKCHDVETWCEQCHGVEMPHPAAFMAQHGGVAANNAVTCEKCHQSRDKTFCIRCHGVEMPHPAFWYSGHGDIARDNAESCARCHPAEETFCNQCHHAGFQPTEEWDREQHGEAVESRGVDDCFVCHEQTFCERCHSRGRYEKR